MSNIHEIREPLIKPLPPAASAAGRPPMGIERMLRMYLLQIWFNLSDPATEDAIYDSYAMRKFTGINFLTETVPDVTVAAKLLRKDDEVVYGDSGYLGLQKRPEISADPHLSAIDYRINRRPHSLPRVSDNAIDWDRLMERRKSSVRCKVAHAFRIIKCQFGYTKTRYRGLKKNENRLYAMFTCANLYVLAMAGRSLREA